MDKVLNDFVKMELISIAYDNKSDYYNEYIIFPLQVESMKNRDIEKD
ncbi:MAG: hypothetical protein LBC61_01395 [Candidatus Peribacteria bacterium]|nr:hypothetical protein [Candidatus Peribacteria bacterium]